MSIDGFGDIGKFSRPGWTDERFYTNYNMLKSLKNANLGINWTMTSVSIFGLADALKFCRSENINGPGLQLCKLPSVKLHETSSYLSCTVLKKEVILDEIEKCRKIVQGSPELEKCLDDFDILWKSHFKQEKFYPHALEVLKDDCKYHGMDGFFEILTQGKLNQ